ncbi:MAG: iron chelate uptake ABC transporter family permease subunit, partial [Haloferacaceae archaeon]
MQLNLPSMRMGLRIGVWTAGLTTTLLLVTVVSAAIGPVSLDVPTVAKASLNAVGIPAGVDVALRETPVLGRSLPAPTVDVRYAYPFSFAVPGTAETIVRQVRLPRIALGGVVGFALASAGTVMQGFFRNPMADPSIIGVSSGA